MRDYFSVALFLAFFAGYSALFPLFALAVQFPEPDPPKIDLPPKEQSLQPHAVLPQEAPATEWTLHKTSDNAHPDGNEQRMLWLMNRARANPAQEGEWLATMDDPDVASARTHFGVDLNVLQNEFSSYDSKPPAAFDSRLYSAALEHSLDLTSRDAQDHEHQFDRISAAGFVFTSARGNVSSYTKHALYGHSGFNIDWGPGDATGMQPGRGHRKAVMSIDGDYTNVGIAMATDSDPTTSVGPFVLTGNYCKASTQVAEHFNRFIVGTVWMDVNGNSMYDPGEGIPDVTVVPDRGNYYAITSYSGGYAIPVTSPGIYQVTFIVVSFPQDSVKTVSVGEESVLLDLVVELETSQKTMPWIPLLLLHD